MSVSEVSNRAGASRPPLRGSSAATLVYHAIALWVPAVWGTIAFFVLQKTKKQPIVLHNPTEELHPRSH